ncbi:MAG: hypothetical protein H0V21_10545 [Rubrobacter sp.]|nr:hypothetical protein [Rubrobacter sp.]
MDKIRSRVEVAVYRELRLIERQRAVRLRTAAAAVVVAAGLVGAGGYWLGTADETGPAPSAGIPLGAVKAPGAPPAQHLGPRLGDRGGPPPIRNLESRGGNRGIVPAPRVEPRADPFD